MRKIILILSVFACFSIFADEDFSNEDFSDEDKYRIAKKIQLIIIGAKKEWPEDYRMQVYTVKNQTESMLEMEKLSKQMKISTKEKKFHEIGAKKCQ